MCVCHQSQSSAISATTATQSEGRCRQVPRLPRKVKVDVAKCHACHANSRDDHGDKWGPSAPPEPVQCHKCHAQCPSKDQIGHHHRNPSSCQCNSLLHNACSLAPSPISLLRTHLQAANPKHPLEMIMYYIPTLNGHEMGYSLF